ncbi:hypothetical protein CC78DRAFT_579803 [Lojkania enalia]|uniref:Uncharacterized protein n=1 Tax=Lojkania enalia TaxID=147567 RepID=A0A9P4KAK3_9PLEO|nr:hypothetical protein CC78DRAFT_579803 [Didymosphaeria enalia]
MGNASGRVGSQGLAGQGRETDPEAVTFGRPADADRGRPWARAPVRGLLSETAQNKGPALSPTTKTRADPVAGQQASRPGDQQAGRPADQQTGSPAGRRSSSLGGRAALRQGATRAKRTTATATERRRLWRALPTTEDKDQQESWKLLGAGPGGGQRLLLTTTWGQQACVRLPLHLHLHAPCTFLLPPTRAGPKRRPECARVRQNPRADASSSDGTRAQNRSTAPAFGSHTSSFVPVARTADPQTRCSATIAGLKSGAERTPGLPETALSDRRLPLSGCRALAPEPTTTKTYFPSAVTRGGCTVLRNNAPFPCTARYSALRRGRGRGRRRHPATPSDVIYMPYPLSSRAIDVLRAQVSQPLHDVLTDQREALEFQPVQSACCTPPQPKACLMHPCCDVLPLKAIGEDEWGFTPPRPLHHLSPPSGCIIEHRRPHLDDQRPYHGPSLTRDSTAIVICSSSLLRMHAFSSICRFPSRGSVAPGHPVFQPHSRDTTPQNASSFKLSHVKRKRSFVPRISYSILHLMSALFRPTPVIYFPIVDFAMQIRPA